MEVLPKAKKIARKNRSKPHETALFNSSSKSKKESVSATKELFNTPSDGKPDGPAPVGIIKGFEVLTKKTESTSKERSDKNKTTQLRSKMMTPHVKANHLENANYSPVQPPIYKLLSHRGQRAKNGQSGSKN